MPWIILIIISYIMIKSLSELIGAKKDMNAETNLTERRFSLEVFCTLIMTYIIVLIGFGLIYFILSFQGIVLVEDGKLVEVSKLGTLTHSMYFSGVTLLTIGYGDITPIGIGRLIAIIEALIGYVLPAAFVLTMVRYIREDRGRSGGTR